MIRKVAVPFRFMVFLGAFFGMFTNSVCSGQNTSVMPEDISVLAVQDMYGLSTAFDAIEIAGGLTASGALTILQWKVLESFTILLTLLSKLL
ncbi:hypothetical protein Barb6_03075 [Bacteroidales bacterium Barb6]|nr:hypothetical protein Barb6_03075 [Bacteroidales bacterium Barb6]